MITGIIAGCGDATMEPSNDSYEQRIVIEGYLHAGQPVDRIHISRNFPVDADLSKLSVLPDPDETIVQITDLDSDQTYDLEYNTAEDDDWNNYYWTYRKSDFIVEYGKSYKLEVWTVIGGKELHASSVTKVPEQGFEIVSIKTVVYMCIYKARQNGRPTNVYDLSEFRNAGSIRWASGYN